MKAKRIACSFTEKELLIIKDALDCYQLETVNYICPEFMGSHPKEWAESVARACDIERVLGLLPTISKH